MVVLVDKLLKTQIVDCSSVANWLFSADMAPDFTRYIYIHKPNHKYTCYVIKVIWGGGWIAIKAQNGLCISTIMLSIIVLDCQLII